MQHVTLPIQGFHEQMSLICPFCFLWQLDTDEEEDFSEGRFTRRKEPEERPSDRKYQPYIVTWPKIDLITLSHCKRGLLFTGASFTLPNADFEKSISTSLGCSLFIY